MENASVATGAISPSTADVMTVKDWIITTIVVAIPIVGFIMLFVWAFGDGTNPNKANWAKASLIVMVIVFLFAFLIFTVAGGLAVYSGM